MKKAYVTPEVIVHGTVEDMTQGALVTEIYGYRQRRNRNNGNGGNGGGGGDGS